jgi:hypothetical protein
MSGNKLSIASESIAGQSASTRLNGSTFVDATAKLGDRADRLVAVAMHSATEAALRKLDLIDFIPDSESKAQIRTFQGRRVVVDCGQAGREVVGDRSLSLEGHDSNESSSEHGRCDHEKAGGAH